jgi:hypothetical protein
MNLPLAERSPADTDQTALLEQPARQHEMTRLDVAPFLHEDGYVPILKRHIPPPPEPSPLHD